MNQRTPSKLPVHLECSVQSLSLCQGPASGFTCFLSCNHSTGLTSAEAPILTLPSTSTSDTRCSHPWGHLPLVNLDDTSVLDLDTGLHLVPSPSSPPGHLMKDWAGFPSPAFVAKVMCGPFTCPLKGNGPVNMRPCLWLWNSTVRYSQPFSEWFYYFEQIKIDVAETGWGKSIRNKS